MTICFVRKKRLCLQEGSRWLQYPEESIYLRQPLTCLSPRRRIFWCQKTAAVVSSEVLVAGIPVAVAHGPRKSGRPVLENHQEILAQANAQAVLWVNTLQTPESFYSGFFTLASCIREQVLLDNLSNPFCEIRIPDLFVADIVIPGVHQHCQQRHPDGGYDHQYLGKLRLGELG